VLGGIGMFVLATVGGLFVGFVVGWVVHRVRRKLDDPQVESAIGLVVPFGTYLLAESVHSSGVLAVVVAGIYLGYRSPESGYATRLQDQAVWKASDTILESVVFALIGLQLTAVVRDAGAGAELIGYGLVVTAAAVLARPLWVFPATYVPRALFRGIRKNDPYPPWQVPAVISWTGMRGVVTLAAAFVIPPTVPERDTLVFLAFFVTVATLMLHGLTLPMVIRLLGVRETTSTADVLAEAQAQQAAAQAGIARLDELTADEPDDSPAGHAAMKLRHITQMRANSAWERLGRPEAETGEAPSTVYRRLRREMLTTTRAEFVARRDAGEIDDEVLTRVMRELDLEEATLDRDAAE
jgi:NhaP-type Na+/H+ or K+/H+ antiporter